MNLDFYVYQLRLKNSELPFYIGKGRGRRVSEHFRPSALKKRSHKNSVINKAFREGIPILREILFDGLTEEQAHAKEIELIAFYGRWINGGCLTNATDGGEGVSGYTASIETRLKISASKRGRPLTADHRRKISRALIGRKMPPDAVKRIADANRGKKRTKEQIENSSRALKGVKRSEETKLKMSVARRGQSKSAEHAEAIMFAHWSRNPAWTMADVIYDAWIENGKPGRPTMKKLFPNLGIEKIVKKITNGWNPVIDESWLKYTSKESKNVGI